MTIQQRQLPSMGPGENSKNPQKELWVRQSGTTARFILPLSALVKAPIKIDGEIKSAHVLNRGFS
ncbi:MAG: hypothetical protein Ct9H90mP11_02300 [Acidimicrobiales bacterium]|nr:MAG: hypothetical protein Ct9H90mP11_02300 [Acidimicrobiales bacterium]